MQEISLESPFVRDLHARIVQGATAAIAREVERRRRLGLPIHISRNGHVETVITSGQSNEPKPC